MGKPKNVSAPDDYADVEDFFGELVWTEVTYMDKPIQVGYDMAAMTVDAYQRMLAEFGDETAGTRDPRGLIEFFLSIRLQWKLRKAGATIETDETGLRSVPVALLRAILYGLVEDQSPNPTTSES